jgi:hypothetical protein
MLNSVSAPKSARIQDSGLLFIKKWLVEELPDGL